MALWEDLPIELLREIAERLTTHVDFLTFSLVCKSWHAVALENYDRFPFSLPLRFCLPQRNAPPLMMLSSNDGSDYYSLYSSCEQKCVGGVHLSELHGKWLCASTMGWFLLVDFMEKPEELELFNPITRARIQLPPLSTFPIPNRTENDCRPDFIRKAVLSSDPNLNSDSWILMVIACCHGRLCFTRAGEEKWTLIGFNAWEWQLVSRLERNIRDVICYKGIFHAVNQFGVVSFCDFDGAEPKLRVLSKPISGFYSNYRKYLVVTSEDKLVLVVRLHKFNYKVDIDGVYQTISCTFFQLVKETQEWIEISSLGDAAVFLGRNSSILYSALDFPKMKRNCVYFTDESYPMPEQIVRRTHWCVDNGIYDVKEFEGASSSGEDDESDMESQDEDECAALHSYTSHDSGYYVPPIWFVPNTYNI